MKLTMTLRANQLRGKENYIQTSKSDEGLAIAVRQGVYESGNGTINLNKKLYVVPSAVTDLGGGGKD